MKWNNLDILKKAKPLLHLWPGVVTLVLIGVLLPVTGPVLAELPQRLSASEEVVEESQPAGEGEDTQPQPEELAAVMDGSYVDGVYTGSAQGYGGLITVQVTVAEGRITAIEVLSAEGETESFFRRAVAVVDTVLTSQSWEVDTISGATYSSRGILAAVEAALTGNQVETEAPAQEEPVSTLKTDAYETPENGYADGTYTGSATGFGGEICVEVTITGGKLSALRILSAEEETPSYLSRATAVVDRVLAAGSPEVDTISGATYSSNGILNATKRALAKAAKSAQPEEETTTTPEESQAQPKEAYRDGLYLGTGEGYGGDITLRVNIENGRIADIRLLSAECETAAYLTRASTLLAAIQAAQTTEVDVVSGATYSSQGIIDGVKAALSEAVEGGAAPSQPEGDTVSPSQPEEDTTAPSAPTAPAEPEPEPEPSAPAARYGDGTYTGSALCTDGDLFSYRVQVAVTISGGSITQVSVSKEEDTSEDPESNDTYLTYATEGRTRKGVFYEGLVSQLLTKQSGEELDAVSSATYSSQAIAQGAQQALKRAEEAAG